MEIGKCYIIAVVPGFMLCGRKVADGHFDQCSWLEQFQGQYNVSSLSAFNKKVDLKKVMGPVHFLGNVNVNESAVAIAFETRPETCLELTGQKQLNALEKA